MISEKDRQWEGIVENLRQQRDEVGHRCADLELENLQLKRKLESVLSDPNPKPRGQDGYWKWLRWQLGEPMTWVIVVIAYVGAAISVWLNPEGVDLKLALAVTTGCLIGYNALLAPLSERQRTRKPPFPWE